MAGSKLLKKGTEMRHVAEERCQICCQMLAKMFEGFFVFFCKACKPRQVIGVGKRDVTGGEEEGDRECVYVCLFGLV